MTLQLLILFVATTQYNDPNVAPVWDQLNTLKRICDQWGYCEIVSVWEEEEKRWYFVDHSWRKVGMKRFGQFAKNYNGGLKWPVKPRPDLQGGIIERLMKLLIRKPTRYRGSVKVEFDITVE